MLHWKFQQNGRLTSPFPLLFLVHTTVLQKKHNISVSRGKPGIPPWGLPCCRTGFSQHKLLIVCSLWAVMYSSNGQKCCFGFPLTRASLSGSSSEKGKGRRTPQAVLCPLYLVLGMGWWAGVSVGPLSCQPQAWWVGNAIPTRLWHEGLSC